jgi:hypothetical protein
LSIKRVGEPSECVAEIPFGCAGLAVDEDATFRIAAEKDLSHSQAKIYMTLATKGPLTFDCISKILRIDLSEVCRAILRLQKRGFVSVGDAFPIIYPLKYSVFRSSP